MVWNYVQSVKIHFGAEKISELKTLAESDGSEGFGKVSPVQEVK